MSDAPFLTVFLPPENKRNGSSVIIAPGGSNIMLMYGLEGIEVAERFNDWGTTAFVLTYRLSPKYNEAARVLDGNRAMRLQTVVGWRDDHFPGDVCYNQRDSWDASIPAQKLMSCIFRIKQKSGFSTGLRS